MRNNSPEHKQYLVNSISEMQAFIDKVIGNIYDRRDTISEQSLKTMYEIIDRKKANIDQFKTILQSTYNTAIWTSKQYTPTGDIKTLVLFKK